MLNYISDTKSFLKNTDAILFDYNGIIYNPDKNEAYEEIRTLIKAAKEKNIAVYVSSNSTASVDAFEGNMSKLGYKKGEDYNGILTAGGVFRTALVDEPKILLDHNISFDNKKIYPIGHVFEGVIKDSGFSLAEDSKEADFAYIGIPQITKNEYLGLDFNLQKGFVPSSIVEGNYDVLASSEEAVKYFYKKNFDNLGNLKVVNANQDKVVKEFTPSGEIVSLARQGFFAEIHKKYNKPVIPLGKPYPEILNLAVKNVVKDLGILNPRINCIGDNMGTDILGVNLFNEGKEKYSPEAKDAVLFSTLCLNSYWEETDATVRNVIKHFEKPQSSKMPEEMMVDILGSYVNDVSRMMHKGQGIPNQFHLLRSGRDGITL